MYENSCIGPQENAQTKIQPIAIAIALTHKGFGTVILALDKAIGNAYRQKLEKREAFCQQLSALKTMVSAA
jgi:hypothetical protein